MVFVSCFQNSLVLQGAQLFPLTWFQQLLPENTRELCWFSDSGFTPHQRTGGAVSANVTMHFCEWRLACQMYPFKKQLVKKKKKKKKRNNSSCTSLNICFLKLILWVSFVNSPMFGTSFPKINKPLLNQEFVGGEKAGCNIVCTLCVFAILFQLK
jgi:hypothetical protein